MSSDAIPVKFSTAGLSSDKRTNRWRVNCGKCDKPFNPPTTMMSRQDFDCPHCGAQHFANWNADKVVYHPNVVATPPPKRKRTRTMKRWNGGAFIGNKQVAVCVAAYSQQDAVDLLNELGFRGVTVGYIRHYFSPTWGAAMSRHPAAKYPERGVWMSEHRFADDWKRVEEKVDG